MQLQIRIPFAQRGPFGVGFLNPILPEGPLSGRDHRLDRSRTISLGNRQQGDGFEKAPGISAGYANFVAHGVKGGDWVVARCKHGESKDFLICCTNGSYLSELARC